LPKNLPFSVCGMVVGVYLVNWRVDFTRRRCYPRDPRPLPIPNLVATLGVCATLLTDPSLRKLLRALAHQAPPLDESPLLCATLPAVVVDSIHGSIANPDAHLGGVCCLLPEVSIVMIAFVESSFPLARTEQKKFLSCEHRCCGSRSPPVSHLGSLQPVNTC
jgi:hypothetical protein